MSKYAPVTTVIRAAFDKHAVHELTPDDYSSVYFDAERIAFELAEKLDRMAEIALLCSCSEDDLEYGDGWERGRNEIAQKIKEILDVQINCPE